MEGLWARMRDAFPMVVALTVVALLASCSGAARSTAPSPTNRQSAETARATPGLASRTTEKPPVHPDDALAVGIGTVQHRGLQVRVGPTEKVSIAPSVVAPERRGEIRALASQGVLVSHPVRITTDTGAGGQLTQTLAEPLPEAWEAGFLTFDEDLQEWTAVPAEVLSDRTQLTARVDHFSDWWHYLMPSEIGETMRVGWASTVEDWSDPAETADYYISDVLSVRVDQPQCSGEPPTWVMDTVFMKEHRNNPVHFCAGSSPQDASLLQVKVRVNRGFGMLVTTAPAPVQAGNTTYDDASAVLLDSVADLGRTVATGLGPTIGGGSYLGAGQEITLVFDEVSLRAAGDGPLVQLAVPDVTTFAVSQVAAALTELGLGRGDSTSLAILGVVQCQADLKDTASGSSAATATARCALTWLTDNWKDFGIPSVLPSDVLKRAGLYLQLFSAVVDVGAYISTAMLNEAALRVSVTLTPNPPPWRLKDALLPPGSCTGWSGNEQWVQLRDGQGEARDASGAYAGISVMSTELLGEADVDGDGRTELVVSLLCTGFEIEWCCAGQTSMMTSVAAFRLDSGDLSLVAPGLMGGQWVPGDENGPISRGIVSASLEGTTLVTTEYTPYAHSFTPEDLGGHDPSAQITARYVVQAGEWVPAP